MMIYFSVIHNGSNHREIIVRSLFFMVILFIFSKLWQLTQFEGPKDQQQMVWYMAITEMILLSIPLVYVDIENDIRSGDVVYQLLKPVNYIVLKLSDSIGALVFRFFILAAIALPFCTYLSGYTPPLLLLAKTLFCALLAGLVFVIYHIMIGLTAFKLQDSSPIYWIWQRSGFLFGGMLLPLDYYPWYLKKICAFLPFSALLYKPANLILHYSVSEYGSVLLGLLFWGAVGAIGMNCLYILMLKSLRVNGG